MLKKNIITPKNANQGILRIEITKFIIYVLLLGAALAFLWYIRTSYNDNFLNSLIN